MTGLRIGILGASGQIAQGLIENLSKKHDLHLYSRRNHVPLEVYRYADLDVLINCIGVKEKLWTDPYRIFTITEEWDGKCIDYCMAHPETLYISFSSSALFGFGDAFDHPVEPGRKAVIDLDMDRAGGVSFYGISKLNSEAKHRALKDLNIVDIRVYSYFSKYTRPDELCLMAEVLACIREGKEMATSPWDFRRDYVHPKDLTQLVERVMEIRCLNTVFDAYSRKPCGKFELLDFLRDRHGLKYRVDHTFQETSPTGPKPCYYSVDTAAQEIGYAPGYTSMDGIEEEVGRIFKQGGL